MITLCITLGVLLLLYVANRVGIQKREGKTWNIEKGKHFSKNSWFPLVLKRRKTGSTSEFRFRINQSMLYDLPGNEDDHDWNKITGEGMLTRNSIRHLFKKKDAPHHCDSWRLGWNFLPPDEKWLRGRVQLGLYYYQATKRKDEILHTFPWYGLQEAEFRMVVDRYKNSTTFTLYTKQGTLLREFTIQNDNGLSGWTYRLRPYFGGNQPAPGQCKVWYEFKR